MCGGLHTSLESYEEGGGVACAKSGYSCGAVGEADEAGEGGEGSSLSSTG